MLDIDVQRVLREYVQRNAPMTFAVELKTLDDAYLLRIAMAHGAKERREIARQRYAAQAALVIMLARQISIR